MFRGVPTFDAVPPSAPAAREPLPPEIPVEHFGEGVALCEIPTPFSMGVTNCWLVIGDDGVLCVDPGAEPDTAMERIGEILARWDRTIDAIDTIVVTHSHADHGGAVAGLAEIADARVLIGAEEVGAMTGRADSAAAVAAAWRGLGAPPVEVERAVARKPPCPPVDASRVQALHDGTELRAGGRSWDVHVMAGHSPGHVVLAAQGVLLSGDHLMANVLPALHLGPAPVDQDGHGSAAAFPWSSSLEIYLASLARFEGGFEETAVLSGHGAAFRGTARPVERARRYHRVRCELVAARLAKRGPSTIWDLSLEMYAGLASAEGVDRRFASAAAEIAGRLEALHRAGRVAVTQRDETLVFQLAHG